MTKAMVRETDFAKFASLDRKSLNTFLLAVADEVDQQRGERLRELRRAKGDPPQPVVAQALGVSLRSYQSWEAGGGIRYDNREALAEYFDVPLGYIMGGETPDLVESLSGESSQLQRIEDKLDEVLSRSLTVEQIQALDSLGQLARAGSKLQPNQSGPEEAGPAAQG